MRLIATVVAVTLLLTAVTDRLLVYVLALRGFERGDAIELQVDQQPPGLPLHICGSRLHLKQTREYDADKHDSRE
jgi:hypothetical protein